MPKGDDITMRFNLEHEGEELLMQIKNASFFPYKTGNLKFHATSGAMYTDTTYRIHFDSTVAPYIQYLEEGTKPHNIPGAFGRRLPFGIGGRFNGMFHPGSEKHKGFIKNDCVNTIVNYISSKYNGMVEEVL